MFGKGRQALSVFDSREVKHCGMTGTIDGSVCCLRLSYLCDFARKKIEKPNWLCQNRYDILILYMEMG